MVGRGFSIYVLYTYKPGDASLPVSGSTEPTESHVGSSSLDPLFMPRPHSLSREGRNTMNVEELCLS